jgi:hypothetical protein
MKRPLRALSVALGVYLLAATTVFACGDKFLVLGRGVRFQRINASAHLASILIYMNPASQVPAADKEFQLQSTLKLAGHKLSVVEDQRGLDKALKSGKYDIVLADLSDAAAVEPEAHAAASKPAVIPVVYNPTGTELAQAEKQYSCLAKASKKNHDLLAVIDEAMQSKAKSSEVRCQKGK